MGPGEGLAPGVEISDGWGERRVRLEVGGEDVMVRAEGRQDA
jgi:hypothetical protein